jgi:hypothetical protein
MTLGQALVCLFFGAVIYGIGFWRGITTGFRQFMDEVRASRRDDE